MTEARTWSTDRMISMCIKRNRYTRGDCRAYENMLDFVANSEPTIENIERAAIDIVEHSNMESYGMDFEECVEAIMFDIANDVVIYSFAR